MAARPPFDNRGTYIRQHLPPLLLGSTGCWTLNRCLYTLLTCGKDKQTINEHLLVRLFAAASALLVLDNNPLSYVPFLAVVYEVAVLRCVLLREHSWCRAVIRTLTPFCNCDTYVLARSHAIIINGIVTCVSSRRPQAYLGGVIDAG